MSTTQTALTTVTALAAAVTAWAAVWSIAVARRERREERRSVRRREIGELVGLARSLVTSTQPAHGLVSLPEEAREAAMQTYWSASDRITERSEIVIATYGSVSEVGALATGLNRLVIQYMNSLQWLVQHWEEPVPQERWVELDRDRAAVREKADALERVAHSARA